MVKDTGSLILKKGFGELTEARSFIAGIPRLGPGGDITITHFGYYLKILLNRIRSIPTSKLEPSHLLETAYDKIFNTSNEFVGGQYSDGFLYPRKYGGGGNGLPGVIESLETAVKTKALIHVGYRSARRGYSGEPILVNRPYVGRVSKIAEDKKSFQLKIGAEDYRTFRVAELQWFGNFRHEHADGVMGHVQLNFTPKADGRVLLSWQVIEGENSPLLTEPWHEPLDRVEKQLLKQDTEESASKEGYSLGNRYISASDVKTEEDELIPFQELRDHCDYYIRIDRLEEDTICETIHTRLIATQFYPKTNELRIIGEGGIQFSGKLDEFRFYNFSHESNDD